MIINMDGQDGKDVKRRSLDSRIRGNDVIKGVKRKSNFAPGAYCFSGLYEKTRR